MPSLPHASSNGEASLHSWGARTPYAKVKSKHFKQSQFQGLHSHDIDMTAGFNLIHIGNQLPSHALHGLEGKTAEALIDIPFGFEAFSLPFHP